MESLLRVAQWSGLGVLGAIFIGQALAGNLLSVALSALIFYFAGSDIQGSLQKGLSWFPPFLTFIVAVVYGGHFRKFYRIQGVPGSVSHIAS